MRFVRKVPNITHGIKEHQALDSKDLIVEEKCSNHYEEETSKQNIWEVENPNRVVTSDAIV